MRQSAQIGTTYHQLTVKRRAGSSVDGYATFECFCTCATAVLVQGRHLVSGHTKSCGCRRRVRGVPLEQKVEHRAWLDMIQRCENPNNKSYKRFGGAGIKVCAKWRSSFAAFFKDLGARPPGGFLVRRDNTKDYTPANTLWERPALLVSGPSPHWLKKPPPWPKKPPLSAAEIRKAAGVTAAEFAEAKALMEEMKKKPRKRKT